MASALTAGKSLVAAAITGLLLGQLANPHPRFEERVFRPAPERLFERLISRGLART